MTSTRRLYEAAVNEDKRLVGVPGSSHGVSIVDAPGAARSMVRDLILEFIRSHTEAGTLEARSSTAPAPSASIAGYTFGANDVPKEQRR
jgi:hypothetical protein